MAKKYVGANSLYLAGSGSIVGATSITLTTFTDIYGNTLTMSDFGDLGYITFEPDTTNQEFATFTGVTANANTTFTLTGVKTVLAKSPYTQTSGLTRSHSGGTKVVISDSPAFWDTFVNKNNDETISGKYTFPNGANRLVLDSDTDTANPAAIVTFGQLSRQAVAGASNASTTVKGLVELATQAELDARSTTGGTGALLVQTPDTQRSTLLSDYKADTGTANAYVITPSPAITAYAVGQIFSFKATNANTTSSTLNVNGLGARTIKKVAGATDLVAGDIAAGMIVLVEYDGTNFIMLNPVANTVSLAAGVYPAGSGANLTNIPGPARVSMTVNVASGVTTTTVTHNLGVIPRYAYFRSVPRQGTATALCSGHCEWNNSTGVLVRQNFDGWNYDTNGAVISFKWGTSSINNVFASGSDITASVGTTTSSSFTLTHSTTTGIAYDIHLEVYA